MKSVGQPQASPETPEPHVFSLRLFLFWRICTMKSQGVLAVHLCSVTNEVGITRITSDAVGKVYIS